MRLFILFTIFLVNISLGNTARDTSSFRLNSNLDIEINKYENTNIVIDGALEELIWQKLSRLGNFCEVEPHEKAKPEVETEVMMYYDNNNLYFGFICHENDMGKLRKTLTDRDKMFSDDWVGFILDTYSEGKQAYEIFTNPLGIQGDLMWTAPGNEDASYDAVWYSAAKTYKDKWTAEIVIPFKTLRFPNKELQEWRFHLLRTRPRENRYQYFWVPISRDDPTLFTHYATLKGIKEVKAGNNLEVLPYALSSQSGSISDFGNSDSGFDNEKIKGQVGINLRYGITSNLTADFALNPDFSQVESDAGQIDVNNPYALYYTEKRPFFIEGNSMFNSPSTLVYTRAVNNPLSAFKLTGKIGSYDIGFISAYDRNSPFILPFEEKSITLFTSRKSLSNILRIKKSFNKDDSYIGFIYTDREVSKDNKKFLDVDGYNRVLSVDGNYRFLENYSFTFQLTKYITKEINLPEYVDTNRFYNGKYTSALDGESYSGYGGSASLVRSARHWNFSIDYGNASPVARRDDGYITANNFGRFSTSQVYTFNPETKTVNRIEPGFYAMARHDYDGRMRELFFAPQVNISFTKQVYLYAQLYLVNNEQYGGVYHQGARRFNMNLNLNTFDNLTGGMYLAVGKYIVRDETNPFIGWGYNLELWQTIKLLDRFVLENDWNYYEVAKNYGDEKVYAGYIFRNKSTFQFTKNMSVRLVTQYDSFQQNFNVNPLFSYKLNPFTIFYIGSTYNYDNIDNSTGIARSVLSGRQFFLKFQYLWRM
jgi:hypothetical protein